MIKEEFLQKHDNVFIFDEVESTNTLLKEWAEKGAKEGTVILSYRQTGGKGSKGRSFFSPDKTGLYISFLFRIGMGECENGLFLTTATAVAVCETLEKFCEKKFSIKWVNDIYKEERKVCGILTEGEIKDGKLLYAVVGIGINLYPPEGGFPRDIINKAGAVFEKKEDNYFEICGELIQNVRKIQPKEYYKKYRERLLGFGKEIYVIKGQNTIPAIMVDLNEECNLCVEYKGGEREWLGSGEITLYKS